MRRDFKTRIGHGSLSKLVNFLYPTLPQLQISTKTVGKVPVMG